uniref:F-box domain-containing protein n=1 Tax=Oryza barthii TaxID=65489 RepID=A0A0D3FW70_9ORYZ
MEPVAKRRRRRQRHRSGGRSTSTTGGEDRLGALPDDLLHTVMSFMAAREVVRTCVLSKRWRHLWRSAPFLNLDGAEFMPLLGGGSPGEWERMDAFVTTLLRLRSRDETAVDSFRLFVDHLGAARQMGPRRRRAPATVLEINVVTPSYPPGHYDGYTMPDLIITSRAWRRLTRLHLSHAWLDGGFGEQLGDGCPLLEDLALRRCAMAPGFRRIRCGSLRTLVLHYTGCGGGDAGGGDEEEEEETLVISAPRLASVRVKITSYACRHGVSFDGSTADSLVEASIRVGRRRALPTGVEAVLLAGMVNVTTLELEGIQAKPVAKRPSRAGGGGSAAGDRLSALPDGLLHAVMSFLPAPGKPCRPACSPRGGYTSGAPCLASTSKPREFPGSIEYWGPNEKWGKVLDFTTNLLMFHHMLPL